MITKIPAVVGPAKFPKKNEEDHIPRKRRMKIYWKKSKKVPNPSKLTERLWNRIYKICMKFKNASTKSKYSYFQPEGSPL